MFYIIEIQVFTCYHYYSRSSLGHRKTIAYKFKNSFLIVISKNLTVIDSYILSSPTVAHKWPAMFIIAVFSYLIAMFSYSVANGRV